MVDVSVKAARVTRGLTQIDVARELGVSVPTYTRIEKDPNLMSIARGKKLAAILGMSFDDIVLSTDSTSNGVSVEADCVASQDE